MKVTPFKKVDEEEKERKFEAGLNDTLQKAMKLYPRGNLREMMESARIASPIHPPSNGKKNGNGNGPAKKKDPSKERTEPGSSNNKRPPPPTKPKIAKRGKFLSPQEVKAYISEGRYF